MKNRCCPLQIDAPARSPTLRNSRAKRPEETLYVGPGDIRPRGTGEDCLQRPALLAVHAT